MGSQWLPIEQGAAAAAARQGNTNIAQIMEGMLQAFLQAQPKHLTAGKSATPSWQVGGELYSRFRRWLTNALADESLFEHTEVEGESLAQEQKTASLLQRLHVFAAEHLAKD